VAPFHKTSQKLQMNHLHFNPEKITEPEVKKKIIPRQPAKYRRAVRPTKEPETPALYRKCRKFFNQLNEKTRRNNR